MKAILGFLTKRISLSTLIYLALIYLIMYFVLLGAELVVRGTSVEVLRLLVLFGVLIGWVLGRTSLKFWSALLIGLVSGFILTLIHIGGIDISIWNLIKASIGYLVDLIFKSAYTIPIQGVGDPPSIELSILVVAKNYRF